ncbi:MAG: hypothetical protein ABIO76_06340, partial [Ginsengibacter sp.]
MKNALEILNELKAISPLIAGLEKVNVFTVPEGYFNKLSERISNFAIFSSRGDSNSDTANVQDVPNGYFENLSTNILAKVKNLYPETTDEELNKMSPLLYSLKDKNVYQVPDGYFDSLSTSIRSKAKKLPSETAQEELQALSPTLYSLVNEIVFTVPKGYFDSLSNSILEKVKKLNSETADEELRSLSPLLYSFKNEQNVFKIPYGYFAGFADDVIKKLRPSWAKVVVMKSRRSWLRIAAAAVVTGIIAISSLQIFNNSSNQNDPKTTTIAASATIPDYVKESFQFKTEAQVDAGIAKLSDDEIIKYLEKNGNVMD